MISKIKELWKKLMELTKKDVFLWGYPLFAITLLSITPPRILGLILLLIWVVAVVNNTHDEEI
jgi:hypothetical protein